MIVLVQGVTVTLSELSCKWWALATTVLTVLMNMKSSERLMTDACDVLLCNLMSRYRTRSWMFISMLTLKVICDVIRGWRCLDGDCRHNQFTWHTWSLCCSSESTLLSQLASHCHRLHFLCEHRIHPQFYFIVQCYVYIFVGRCGVVVSTPIYDYIEKWTLLTVFGEVVNLTLPLWRSLWEFEV